MGITHVDVSRYSFDIHRDLSVSTRPHKPGLPERIDGITIGLANMDPDAPPRHGGEVHPDGDEILFVISGRIRVIGESAPDEPVELGPGAACIVQKGEWHRVTVLDQGKMIHITPGPHGNYRPVPSSS